MKIVIDNGKKSVIYKNKAPNITMFCEQLTFEMQKIDKNISVHCRYDFEKDEDSIQIIREWKNKRNRPITKEEKEEFLNKMGANKRSIYKDTDSIRNDPD